MELCRYLCKDPAAQQLWYARVRHAWRIPDRVCKRGCCSSLGNLQLADCLCLQLLARWHNKAVAAAGAPHAKLPQKPAAAVGQHRALQAKTQPEGSFVVSSAPAAGAAQPAHQSRCLRVSRNQAPDSLAKLCLTQMHARRPYFAAAPEMGHHHAKLRKLQESAWDQHGSSGQQRLYGSWQRLKSSLRNRATGGLGSQPHSFGRSCHSFAASGCL